VVNTQLGFRLLIQTYIITNQQANSLSDTLPSPVSYQHGVSSPASASTYQYPAINRSAKDRCLQQMLSNIHSTMRLPIELFRLALLASTTQVLHMVQVQHSNASNWTDVL
jgi:hypothetical protein